MRGEVFEQWLNKCASSSAVRRSCGGARTSAVTRPVRWTAASPPTGIAGSGVAGVVEVLAGIGTVEGRAAGAERRCQVADGELDRRRALLFESGRRLASAN